MQIESESGQSMRQTLRAIANPGTFRLRREVATAHIVGPTSVLMQLAYPAIAEAGLHHSYGTNNLLKRTMNTFALTSDLLTGTDDQAQAAARKINAVHEHMANRGVAAAVDPDALEWVWLTLVNSTLEGQQFIEPLTRKQKRQFFEHSRSRVALIGVTNPRCKTVESVRPYILTRVALGDVYVTDAARAVMRKLFEPFQKNPLVRFSGNFVGSLTANLLPQELVRQYDLPWKPLPKPVLEFTKAFWRLVLPRVSTPLRGVEA